MIRTIPTLSKLIVLLQKIPYLASRNMYRVASHFLYLKAEQIDHICAVLQSLKRNIKRCATCFYWQEVGMACIFCSADKRDQQTVCVVERWHDVLAIEKTEGYHGVYHVLGGSICPLEGVGPEQLTIDALVDRVKTNSIKEIIFALSQTPEGQATSAFINKKLQGQTVTVSCLARGVPVGSSLDTMDRVTVYKALSERRPF